MTDAIKIDSTANPAPLGLLGFGMTTILLNCHNAGLIPLNSVVLSMGIFFGGLTQVAAGIMEWKKGNTFAATAFTAYGTFWIALVSVVLLPKASLGVTAADSVAMALFLGLWGVFSVFMFVGTFRLNKALQVTFGLLVVLFALLIAGDLTGNASVTVTAGWEGILCGAAAFYTGIAQVLNEVYARTVMPLGPVLAK